MGERTAREVLDDHLSMSLGGCVEEDVTRNYAEDVTVLSNWGVEQGHDGVRRLAALLQAQLPDCVFTYTLRLVEGEVGLLVWDADSAAGSVRGGGLLRHPRWPHPGADDPLRPGAQPRLRGTGAKGTVTLATTP